MLYNLFHYKQLKHNVRLYRKLGIKKFYFSPISSADFANCDPQALMAGKPRVNLQSTAIYQAADADTRQSLDSFGDKGFAILKSYLKPNSIEAINQSIDSLLHAKKIKYKYGNKIMFAIHHSQILRNVATNQDLVELLHALGDGEMQLFQSINFKTGSQQKSHSDSIHMTTFPQGGLLGLWIALEDIGEDQGPLHYYPGSHKLPYYMNADYHNEGNFFLTGNKTYWDYEAMIAQKMNEAKLEKQTFTAKKGDALIWHANLIHGGEPHANKSKSRKSVVFHYFNKQCICYHEINQRPALMRPL